MLRGGRVSLGGGGSDDDDEGDGGSEGDGGGEGERVLLRGGATISSVIATSIEGEKAYGACTKFLDVNMKLCPLGWSKYRGNEGIRRGWIIEVGDGRSGALIVGIRRNTDVRDTNLSHLKNSQWKDNWGMTS
ncbi:hypothetical protein Tco_1050557 [Tanacetum coccineum]